MLPDSELDRLRADILYTLTDTGDILSITRTSDGMGGFTEAWGTATASVACRLDQKQGREQLAGGGYQWYTTNVLSLPATATITTAHRFQMAGVTYAVASVNEGSGIAVKRAIVERVG